MSRRGGRRVKSPHPGVVLRSRTWASGETTWFGRYHDPDEIDPKKDVDVNLTKIGLTSNEARVAWAREKSRAIAKRLGELEEGAERRSSTPITVAIDDYVKHVRARKRGETVAAYVRDAEKFRDWCVNVARLSIAEDLTAKHLAAFRKHVESTPRQRVVSGGRAGERADGDNAIAPGTLNTRLRHLSALVNALRRDFRAPRLTRDAIADVLKQELVQRDPPEPFAPGELQRLLRAALRHDAAIVGPVEDDAGKVIPKALRPYQAIAPTLLFVLLTGTRIGEAVTIEWADVDLTATDGTGAIVGSVRVRAATTKTGRGRVISLGHSPVLRRLLLALRTAHLREREKVLRLDELEQPREATGRVFPGWTDQVQKQARERVVSSFGAPPFTWSAKGPAGTGTLRSTTECYLVNAPAIFGASSVWAAAALLGHDVKTAQNHYLGVLPGLDATARTLEDVMQIGELARQVVARVLGENEAAGVRRGAVS